MFGSGYQHYLSYGATDQRTVRELSDAFDGLLVPGTVAAFQREGTGGFVLSLSATQAGIPYAIDPRFPLFQQALAAPKKSHQALAALVGDPDLVTVFEPRPEDFDEQRLDRIARNWVSFNEVYESAQSAKFDKYAERLGEAVAPADAHGPSWTLAPYFIATDITDPWFGLAERLYSLTQGYADKLEVIRVVACEEPSQLNRLLAPIDDNRLLVWVSGLDEMSAEPEDLAAYGVAIRDTHRAGQQTFALYGGFFGLLLSGVGLAGASHGIGYGEHRAWHELPQSGPPPARYYLPRSHRYIAQDLAFAMWTAAPELTRCHCAVCNGGPPPDSYHELMQHSVLARSGEIERWAGLAPPDASELLQDEMREFEWDLGAAALPRPLLGPARRSLEHLPRWIAALEILDEEQ
jgi:hypothetical protein